MIDSDRGVDKGDAMTGMFTRGEGTLQTLVLSVLLVILVGWLLKIGQAVLLPVFAALISVYVLTTAADALERLPLGKELPLPLRRLIVLVAFFAALAGLALVTTVTVDKLISAAPIYQQNLEQLVARVSASLGVSTDADWQTMRKYIAGSINFRAFLGSLAGSFSSMLGTVVMVAVYAFFLMAEAKTFYRKLAIALPWPGSAAKAERIISQVNEQIGAYLTVKTLLNLVLASISYVILWLWNVDFPLFWALLIGLLNYIPYVGSLMGVAFPVLLAIVQFGTLQTALVLALLLTAAQAWVGNVLEPRWIGEQVNLSAVVVLFSCSVWWALWGITGAILAIPLTSILVIILANFQKTRPIAVMMAGNAEAFQRDVVGS